MFCPTGSICRQALLLVVIAEAVSSSPSNKTTAEGVVSLSQAVFLNQIICLFQCTFINPQSMYYAYVFLLEQDCCNIQAICLLHGFISLYNPSNCYGSR